MREEILRMENIYVKSLNNNILEDFRLYAFKGEIISVVGLSGQGKTALFNILSGKCSIDSGRIIFNNRVYSKKINLVKSKDIVSIGYKSMLISNLSIAENLFVIGNREYNKIFINNRNIVYKTKKLLSKYLPDVKPNTLVKDLTQWQMLMVEICRVIIRKPYLIIIDEAITTCNEVEKDQIEKLLTELKRNGVTIIYESNKINNITKISNRIFVMKNGKNIRILYNDDYCDKLINNLLVGYDIPLNYKRKSNIQENEAFSMKQIKINGIFDKINISLKKGEIIGLFHDENILNHLLLDIIIGKSKIDLGEILIENKKFTPKNISYAKECGIGIIPYGLNNDYIINQMSLEDNITISFIKKFCINGMFIDKKIINFKINEIKNKLNKSNYKNLINNPAYIKQIVLLYREIICNNKILVFLNLYEKIDIVMRDIIYTVLEDVSRQGTAVIIIDNNINEMEGVCDKILSFSNNGKINEKKVR